MRSVFLLYLNRKTFVDDERDTLKDILQTVKEADMDLVLVHEQNKNEGGCTFHHFFESTPEELIERPYELYKEMAIPLYSECKYRKEWT